MYLLYGALIMERVYRTDLKLLRYFLAVAKSCILVAQQRV